MMILDSDPSEFPLTPFEEEIAKADHLHCKNCMKRSCLMPDDPPRSCLLTQCQLECGAIYHSCKEEEHQQLCPNLRIPCINQVNGCPVQLPRNQLGKHLRTCPASVVQCCAEWNRWPAYCKETLYRVPFVREDLHAKYGQLDIALALRDQRALQKAFKAPKNIRRVLRNHLTKIYPAVPLLPNHRYSSDLESTDTSVPSDDDSEAPWEISKYPPGLKCTILNELFSVIKAAKEKEEGKEGEHVKNGDAPGPLHVDVDGEACPAGPPSVPSSGGSMADVSSMERSGTQSPLTFSPSRSHASEINSSSINSAQADRKTETPSPVPKPPAPPQLKQLLGLNVTIEYVSKWQAKPQAMYTFWCAQNFRRDEYVWHYKNVHHDIQSNLNGWMEYRCPLSQYGCTYSLRRFYPTSPESKVYYSELVEGFGVKPDALSEGHSANTTDMSTPADTHSVQVLEDLTRTKSPTPEIITSDDFSAAVIISSDKNCKVQSSSPKYDFLSALPDELLMIIFQYLDGFTLNNLALTCRKMRTLCGHLLEEKGIVVLEWKKTVGSDGHAHWHVPAKRWSFSAAFSPVRKWGFHEDQHMTDHLKHCQFNRHEQYTDVPIKLPGMTPDCMNEYTRNDPSMKRLLAKVNRFKYIDSQMM